MCLAVAVDAVVVDAVAVVVVVVVVAAADRFGSLHAAVDAVATS